MTRLTPKLHSLTTLVFSKSFKCNISMNNGPIALKKFRAVLVDQLVRETMRAWAEKDEPLGCRIPGCKCVGRIQNMEWESVDVTDDSEYDDPDDRANRLYEESCNYDLSEGMTPRTDTPPLRRKNNGHILQESTSCASELESDQLVDPNRIIDRGNVCIITGHFRHRIRHWAAGIFARFITGTRRIPPGPCRRRLRDRSVEQIQLFITVSVRIVSGPPPTPAVIILIPNCGDIVINNRPRLYCRSRIGRFLIGLQLPITSVTNTFFYFFRTLYLRRRFFRRGGVYIAGVIPSDKS